MACIQYNSSHSFLIYLHMTLLAWDNVYMCLSLGVCALTAGAFETLELEMWVDESPDMSAAPHYWAISSALILPFYCCVSYFLSMWWLLSLYKFSCIMKLKMVRGSAVMVQQLKVLAALPKDLGSVPVIHMAVRSCNSSAGDLELLSRHRCRQNTSVHKK